jgi:hypothetical protein
MQMTLQPDEAATIIQQFGYREINHICADDYLQSLNVQATLVCDEDPQFGDALKAIFDKMTTGENPYWLEFGAPERFKNILGMEQVPSACGSRKPVATINRQGSARVIMPLAAHSDDATHPLLELP